MEGIIVKHCAPTLAGLKTANLVNCPKETALGCIKKYSGNLLGKGVKAIILSERNGNALLYVFRPSMLAKDMQNSASMEILSEFGYTDFSVYGALNRLKQRIEESVCFPHEIGLFLGYPAEDVKGFIDNKGQHFKCMGYWKVYCNECEARKTFERYKKCIDVYTRVFLEGASLDKLTVAI